MKNQKPISFSMAGGSNEPSANQVYNHNSMKEGLKRVFNWDDNTLNEFKDEKTDVKFLNGLNVREILMKWGTEIGRYTQSDIHILNHVESIINQIDKGEKIKPIVSVMGYAGHGKDYQISQLTGEFSATGDIRFTNELKFVLVVNEYCHRPKRLKKELLNIAKNFSYDPELLDIKLYTYFLGTGTEELQNDMIEHIEDRGINNFNDFVSFYREYTAEIDNVPTLHELLRKMGYTKNNEVYALYQDIIKKASGYIGSMVEVEDLAEFDLAEFDSELEYFYYELTENNTVVVKTRDIYEFKNNDWIVRTFQDEEDEYNYAYLREKLEKQVEPNKLEYRKLKKEIEGNFASKKTLFNKSGSYIDGSGESLFVIDDGDFTKLSSNNIFPIFKFFKIPESITATNLVQLEDQLVEYHLENVYKPFYNIKEDSFKEVVDLINDLISPKTKVSDLTEKVGCFIDNLKESDKLRKSHGADILQFISELGSVLSDGIMDSRKISQMVRDFVDILQKTFSTPEVYEKEIRSSISNLKNVFSQELSNKNDSSKVGYFLGLLEEYGITRSNPKHESETLLRIIKEKGGDIIQIIPFSEHKDVLQKIIDSNKKRIHTEQAVYGPKQL